MNKFWLVLTIIFLSFSACKAQNKSSNNEWKEFVSDEGKFKAKFPVNPTKTIKDTDVPSGKLQTTRFEVSLAEPEIYFGVMYADQPNTSTMNQDALKVHYDSIRDGFPKMTDAKLISEQDVWVNGNLGRELVLDFAGKTIVTYRTYLIGNRQYQVITSTKSSLAENAAIKRDVNKFLDSFQLVEKTSQK